MFHVKHSYRGDTMSLKILVACEESQRVCIECRKLGHEAFSADIQEPSGGHPEWHIHGDVLNILNGGNFVTMNGNFHNVEKWDLIIAHPPCTYLSNAGANSLWKDHKLNEERFKKGLKGKEFFMQCYNAECEHIAVENPIPSKIYELPKYTQIIQPYMFGEIYSKKTCLWLKGLPKLNATKVIDNPIPYVVSGMYSKTHDAKYKGVSRKGGSAKVRSKTFPGIAQAMAQQWTAYIIGGDKQ